MMEWRNEILKDIEILPKLGIPGCVVVFGKHAKPILTGTQEEDVLIAAAEYGKGRIITISHDAYLTEFTCQPAVKLDPSTNHLHGSLKRWLTKNTFDTNSKIVNSCANASDEDLKSAKIVIFNGGIAKIPEAKLTDYVHNGGALLHCMTPWGWLQLKRGNSLSEAPYFNLLVEAGLCYSDNHISVSDKGFSVKDNKAKGAHLMKALDEVVKDEKFAGNNYSIVKMLRYLPKTVQPDVKDAFKKQWKVLNERIVKEIIPSPKHQIAEKNKIATLSLWIMYVDILDYSGVKASGVDIFPGDFKDSPPLKCHVLEFHSQRVDYHSTGCYLPAGSTMTVEVISGNESKDWQILIGAHVDHLKEDNKIRRWPIVNKKEKSTDCDSALIPLLCVHG